VCGCDGGLFLLFLVCYCSVIVSYSVVVLMFSQAICELF